jgi:hypothetical protein
VCVCVCMCVCVGGDTGRNRLIEFGKRLEGGERFKSFLLLSALFSHVI